MLGFAFVPARSSVRWLSVAREQHEQLDELERAVERVGGRDAALAPGRPAINPSLQTALAWRLDVPLSRVQATWGSTPAHPHWSPPALVFRAPARLAGPAPSLSGRRTEDPPLHVGRWEVLLAPASDDL